MEHEFVCKKCQGLLSVNKVRMGKDTTVLELMCQNNHFYKGSLEGSQIKTWLTPVLKHLYLCPKCGLPLTDVSHTSDAHETELTLNCSFHAAIKKQISNAFWYILKKYKEKYSPKDSTAPIVSTPKPTAEKAEENDSWDEAFRLLHSKD